MQISGVHCTYCIYTHAAYGTRIPVLHTESEREREREENLGKEGEREEEKLLLHPPPTSSSPLLSPSVSFTVRRRNVNVSPPSFSLRNRVGCLDRDNQEKQKSKQKSKLWRIFSFPFLLFSDFAGEKKIGYIWFSLPLLLSTKIFGGRFSQMH